MKEKLTIDDINTLWNVANVLLLRAENKMSDGGLGVDEYRILQHDARLAKEALKILEGR